MVASRLAGPSPLVSLGSYCGHRSARKYSSWSRAVASASRGGVTPVIAAEKAGCIVAESVWYHGVIGRGRAAAKIDRAHRGSDEPAEGRDHPRQRYDTGTIATKTAARGGAAGGQRRLRATARRVTART